MNKKPDDCRLVPGSECGIYKEIHIPPFIYYGTFQVELKGNTLVVSGECEKVTFVEAEGDDSCSMRG